MIDKKILKKKWLECFTYNNRTCNDYINIYYYKKDFNVYYIENLYVYIFIYIIKQESITWIDFFLWKSWKDITLELIENNDLINNKIIKYICFDEFLEIIQMFKSIP